MYFEIIIAIRIFFLAKAGPMNQIERIIKILELLSMKRKLSTDDLHRHFDKQVSLRTVQRDIKAIEAAGIPLFMDKDSSGKNYWYFSRDYKKMVLPSIQPNELLAAYILKSYLKTFKGTQIETDLNSVVDKLETFAPGDVYLDMNTDESIIWNQDFGDFDYQKFGGILEETIRSITQEYWCTVTYEAQKEEQKSFDIFIHRLYTYNSIIYLAVTSEKYNDYITLALHRIIDLKKAANQAQKPDPFDIERFRKNRFAVFSGKPVHIKLQINKETAHYFTNRQWHPSQKLSLNEDGSLLLEMDVPITWELIGWILSWHSFIKALSPPELIDKLQERLKETQELYTAH